jgi:hypothetical protein
MIAITHLRPSVPVRTTDWGVALDAIETGRGLLQRARKNALPVERRAMPAAPDNRGLGADGKEQVELLGEQLVVIVKVVAEQRKGLDG